MIKNLLKPLLHQVAFLPSYHDIVKYLELQLNRRKIQKIVQFFMNFYKEKMSDGDWSVFTALQRRVTALLWSSTWRLTVLLPSAGDVLKIFTLCSLHAQCADCVHNTFVWRSDIPKDFVKSPCKGSWLFTASIWACQRSSSRIAGYLTALLRQPHFVSML